MSYGATQAFRNLAGRGTPIIDSSQFDLVLRTYGWNVRRRRRSEEKDCPCFDPIANQPNPECSICNGTGTIEGFKEKIVRGILLFNAPNGTWQLGNIRTRAGNIERTEAAGYFSKNTDIRIDDLILLETTTATASEPKYHEMRVFNVQPRMVGDRNGKRHPIFLRADMRRSEYNESVSDISKFNVEP